MDWTEKMISGMKMIKEACVSSSAKCAECPFRHYCDALFTEGLPDPFEDL